MPAKIEKLLRKIPADIEAHIEELFSKYFKKYFKLYRNRCEPKCIAIKSIPFTISSPGLYRLTSHLKTNFTSGNAITIEANDVILDLQDFTLDGSAGGEDTDATGIYSQDNENVIIKNGTVRGFKCAINVTSTWDPPSESGYEHSVANIVENIQAIHNTYGIQVRGDGNVIRNNMIYDIGAAGIKVSGWHPVIINNSISKIGGRGIGVGETRGGLIKNNYITAIGVGTTSGICIDLHWNDRVSDLVIIDNQFTTASVGINLDDPGSLSGDIVCKYNNTITAGVGTLVRNPTGSNLVAVGIND